MGVIIRSFFISMMLGLSFNVAGQTLSGKIVNLSDGNPVSGAEITVPGTNLSAVSNSFGEFVISLSEDTGDLVPVMVQHHRITWNLPVSAQAIIYDMAGRVMQQAGLHAGQGDIALNLNRDGIYLLHVMQVDGTVYRSKFAFHLITGRNESYQAIRVDPEARLPDSVRVTKEGFYPQSWPVSESYAEYPVMGLHNPPDIDYLPRLIRREAFTLMQGPPLNPVFGAVQSVKVVYSLADDKIYYTNSTKYFIHYDFARDVLDYGKGHFAFNTEQYTNNPNRLYILASVNHFTAADRYTLEFWAGDELTCAQITRIYDKIVSTSYFGDSLKFYVNSPHWNTCSVPVISSEELYAGQNFQALNPAEAYGYLKKMTLDELAESYAGRHDIVLLNGIPNDISVVAGIITTEFQTPLSHINVLSHNRGAPNMALRDGWTHPLTTSLENKLVYLNVTLDTFELREASIAEAQAFWDAREPSQVTKLRRDSTTAGLINLSQSGITSLPVIGGKAANFAELLKVRVNYSVPLPLPEGAFAIPFFYYLQHLKVHGLDIFIRQMLADSRFRSDFLYRKQQLERLQDSIINSSMSSSLLTLVYAKLAESPSFTQWRFRSSTNSEDIKGFNGAGLYDSFTGIPGDPQKTVERAIKRVWASLWNIGAFEEREYFRIDQNSVAMAVLVHRSFPSEEANGVVITKNLYNELNPGFTINAQQGEFSITNPEGGFLPDEMIWYSYGNVIEYISHSNLPGMEGRTVLSDAEIQQLAVYCSAIQSHFCNVYAGCFPVDIEFKVQITDGVRKIYIKQARLY